MLMYDCLKKEVKSKLVFQFIKNIKRPQYIEILKFKKEISPNADEIEVDFFDSSINDYKIYDCNTKFTEKEETNSISVYYNQKNYFNCGDGKHSVEIIFSDFMNKSLKSKDCVIEYDGVEYTPIEDFGLATRKRINFINVDFHKFKFPKDINGKEVKINTLDNKNFLVFISLVEKPKIIAIYLNNPFNESKLNYTEKEILNTLDLSLQYVKKNIYVKKGELYDSYYKRGQENEKCIIKRYVKEIEASYEIEKKLTEYFLIPREELNKEQIEIYEKYSEFMAYFPDIGSDSRETKKIEGFRYYHQFYYTQLALNHFFETIPKNIKDSDRAKLKYSASRCLRTLLLSGDGENFESLFELINFDEDKTIYKEAKLYNQKFINLLTEKSEIFLFFLQINSGSSINLITNELMSRISMLDEKIIKNNLISTLPTYAIKLLVDSSFRACTYNEVKITCINEYDVLGGILHKSELSPQNDLLCNRRYILANLMQHEDFGHINFSINFYSFYDKYIQRPQTSHYSENLSPFKYYMIKEKKEEIQEIVKETKIKVKKNEENTNNEFIIKGESGIALTFFLTRGKYKLMKVLRKRALNFSELFDNPQYQTAEDLTDYVNKLKDIYNSNRSLFTNDGDDNIEYKTRFEESHDSNPIPYGIPTLEKFDK